MVSAFAVRSQIEAALANRIPSALTPSARLIRPVIPTGIGAVDDALQGGLPVGAVTEMIGPECSGRTGLALSFVAQVTGAGKVCAWVDVSDALSPESAAACGVDLQRLLWVRCGVGGSTIPARAPAERESQFVLPEKYFAPPPVKKGLHGCGMGGHPRGEAKGMDRAVSGLLQAEAIESRCAEPVRKIRAERKPAGAVAVEQITRARKEVPITGGAARPWQRIDQALRSTDLLLQAGGFGAIVLDMGSLAPEYVSRIPLATWFRYRSCAERTQASVVLLTQYACAKSSAGLVLRVENDGVVDRDSTVLAGFEQRIVISRRRFEQDEEKVVPIRKPPQRATAGSWQSRTTWVGPR